MEILGNPADTAYGSNPMQSMNADSNGNATPYAAVLPESMNTSKAKIESSNDNGLTLQVPVTEIINMT